MNDQGSGGRAQGSVGKNRSPVPDSRPLAKNLFISGTPGVGKTSLIKEVTLPFRGRVAGFYTEEVRDGEERRGFRLRTFVSDGEKKAEGLLAEKGLKSAAKVGKYGVDIRLLEDLGVAALRKGLAEPDRLLVIDEVGSMEVLSDAFRETLLACLQSDRPVLATIRHNAQPFTDHLKRMQNVVLVRLTRENYPDVKSRVRLWMDEKLG